MSTSGETADLMVKEGIQITESAVKLAGLGAKNLAALLIALANDNQKLAGKTNLKRLIHDGEELTIFSVKKEDLAGFHGEAKRYGVLYYPIVNKVENTGMVEIMAKAKDAKQINRIFERMGYPAPTQEDANAKKAKARDPSDNSSRERGTGAKAFTEQDTTEGKLRPSVKSKNDLTETDTKEYIEVLTLDSKTKDLEEIIKTLEPELEVVTEDGYSGTLKPNYPSIAVEAAGYKNSSWTVSAKRTYPNLNDADISLIPKTIEDSGRTLTLADVDWQEVPTGDMGDFVEAFRYTANATYTGTAYSKTATGYTVTVEYGGEVTKTSCDTIVYTAVFTATGAAPSAENADTTADSSTDFNYALLLIPLGILALGGVGYGGYKGYKHYQNKKRGYE